MGSEETVFRPSTRAYLGRGGLLLPVAAVLLLISGLAAAAMPLVRGLYLVAVAVLLGVLILYFCVVRVEVGPEVVRKRVLFGLTRSWGTGQVGGCALRSITFPRRRDTNRGGGVCGASRDLVRHEAAAPPTASGCWRPKERGKLSGLGRNRSSGLRSTQIRQGHQATW